MRPVFGVLALAALARAAPVSNAAGEKIPNNYIVVFKEHVSANRVNVVKANTVQFHTMSGSRFKGPGRSFGIGNFKGFSGEFDAKTVKQLQNNPDVAYVEQEQVYRTTAVVNQDLPPWGLARISHTTFPAKPDSPINDVYGQYTYDDEAAGAGVVVHVIDTGTFFGHNEFLNDDGTVRAKMAPTNFAGDSGNADCNGHGTHCSGTIAGKTYGVSKKAEVIGVKVLTCGGSGSTAGVIGGINWVADNHDPAKKCVASMSLGGGKSDALNAAVDAATAKGCIFAIAAGNDGRDAKNTSPASAATAITVGAIGTDDQRMWWSNYGATLAVFAPGNNTLSSWIGGADAVNRIAGTSMATPHVAGLIAYTLSRPEFKDKTWTAAEMKKYLQDTSVGVAGNLPANSNTPGFIINNGYGKTDAPPSEPEPPVTEPPVTEPPVTQPPETPGEGSD